jgi:hypothetical protein
MQDDIVLEDVRRGGDQWLADLTFRGTSHQMRFQIDPVKKDLRVVGDSRFDNTIEGYEVECLVERAHRGEKLALPQCIVPRPDYPRRPSVRDPRWSQPPLTEVWLVGVERLSKPRWRARLRLDGRDDECEIDVVSDSVLDMVRAPKNRWFSSYEYDLTGLLERLHAGERFALPFKLRPRWPTPPDPPSLP